MDQHIYNLLEKGINYQRQGDLLKAEAIYLKALQDHPEEPEPYHLYGTLAHQQEQDFIAVELISQAISLDPNIAIYHLNLGIVFESQELYDQALTAYHRAIDLDPSFSRAHERIGYIYLNQNKMAQAVPAFQKAVELDPTLHDVYVILGNYFFNKKLSDQAEKYFLKAYELDPSNIDIGLSLAIVFEDQSRTEDAIKWYRQVLKISPDHSVAKWKEKLVLPRIYSSQEQINFYRQRYTQGLIELENENNLHSQESREIYQEGAFSVTSFYLNYQGMNDRLLQEKFSNLIHRSLSKYYPRWIKPLSLPDYDASTKIRIGYVSHHFRLNTVTKLFMGWIKNHDRSQFSVYCYYTNSVVDQTTHELMEYVDSFSTVIDLEEACQKITSDHLHILVFLDIPMSYITTQLSCLRLAPIQCTTWTQPVTSGSPTIDYFISSDLMEPLEGEKFYSERLIRLPGIGICYDYPVIPERGDRTTFNLPDDSILYLSCQFFPKYLPQYDYIFPEIALQMPNAKFLFISRESDYIAKIFRARLESSFLKVNLNFSDYCLILPRLNMQEYLQVNLLSDIYLDTLSWSGGNTTLEAIACGLPVVTCPGSLMRSRHSAAILTQLGVTETIAYSELEYIQLGVKLGIDTHWRIEIKDKIKSNLVNLFAKQLPVRALESFYQQVVRKR